MARCGCGSNACSCVVNGSGLATVTGIGTPNSPYVVGVTCTSVRTCFSAGDGIDITDGVISAEPLDCADVRACFTAGPNITITNGVITGTFDCDEARACFTGGDSINYDATTGDFDLCLSTDAGNAAVLGTDGCLYVPPGGGTATVIADGNGTQLTGAGTAGSPYTVNVVPGCGITASADGVAANVQAWPYPCPPETNGGGVYCDANGELKVAPAQNPMTMQDTATIVGPVNQPPTNPNPGACVTATVTIDLTDSCYDLRVATWSGFSFDVTTVAGDDFDVSTQRFVDGVQTSSPSQVLRWQNATAGRNAERQMHGRVENAVLTAGSVHTISSRTCLTNNNAAGAIIRNSLEAYIGVVGIPIQ